MRRSNVLFIAVLSAMMLFFAGGYALAERPATFGFEPTKTSRGVAPQSSGFTTKGLRVIIVLSDHAGDECEVRDSLLASGIAEEVGVFNAQVGTPTLDELTPYDHAIVWSNYTFADPTGLGNVLADYVEAGGAVILCGFSFYSGWALAGRIMTEYSPFTTATSGYETHNLGWYDPTHPIMENVTTCSEYFDFAVSLQGNVMDVAHYDNDWKMVAVNADYPNVVAINSYFGQSYRQWTGDMMTIMLNSVAYISRRGPAVSIELVPDHSPVVVPRGGSFGFTGTLTNNTDQPQVVDAGTIAIGPEKGVYGWFKKFRDLELAPYETRTAHFDQHVNDRAPLGIYSYIGYCGDYPSSVTDSSFFPIEVTAEALAKAGASDWTLTGSFLEGSTADLPTEFALLGNYPNPFNAETNISFSLAEAGNVSLKVYDISGRLVGTLVEDFQEAGEYTVTWEALGASSGIYFYKFNAGEWSETRRMSLIR